jgi:hypothetical protein
VSDSVNCHQCGARGDAACVCPPRCANAAALVDAILNTLQDDPHQWSERPCPTCRAITGLRGKPFGCNLFAEQRATRRGSAR